MAQLGKFNCTALAVLAFLLAPGLHAETTDTATKAIEESFIERFGKMSFRKWTNGDTLRSLIGRTNVIADSSKNTGALLNADGLEPFLGSPVPRFTLSRRVDGIDGVHYEFTQNIAGVPVENAVLTVDIASDDRMIGLTNKAEPGLTIADLGAGIGPVGARCFAAADVLQTVSNCDLAPPRGPQMPDGASAFHYTVTSILYAVPPFARRAFAVEVTSSAARVSRRYVIDARGGFIIERRDRVHSFDGHAFVFNPNPFTDHAVHSMKDLTSSSAAYESRVLPRISKPATGDLFLHGDYVHIKNGVRSPDGNFPDKRGTEAFAASMAYFHITGIQDRVQRLGFTNVANRPIDVDIAAFPGLNAFYTNDPEGCGFLEFSVRDDLFYIAEDGDVVAHEYGHALQSSQALGKYDNKVGQTRAMYEGFGDYWSMSYFDSINRTNGFALPCLGEWARRSAGAFTDCLRTVDLAATKKVFDANPNADEHETATVWTAALWAVHEKIGGDDADRIILRSHLSVPDSPTFAEGARAMFTADQALNGGLFAPELCTIFVDRQILAKKECKPLP